MYARRPESLGAESVVDRGDSDAVAREPAKRTKIHQGTRHHGAVAQPERATINEHDQRRLQHPARREQVQRQCPGARHSVRHANVLLDLITDHVIRLFRTLQSQPATLTFIGR